MKKTNVPPKFTQVSVPNTKEVEDLKISNFVFATDSGWPDLTDGDCDPNFWHSTTTSAKDYGTFFFGTRPEISKVIFHDPATIVYWSDKTKTIVKCENEKYDPEKGLAMAISKKFFGNKGCYYEHFKKWLPKEKK